MQLVSIYEIVYLFPLAPVLVPLHCGESFGMDPGGRLFRLRNNIVCASCLLFCFLLFCCQQTKLVVDLFSHLLLCRACCTACKSGTRLDWRQALQLGSWLSCPIGFSLAPTVASRILFICVLDCAVLFVWVPLYRGPILCVCLLSASCPKNGVFGDAFDRSLRSPGFLPFLGQMFWDRAGKRTVGLLWLLGFYTCLAVCWLPDEFALGG